ncbi:unnamed protein product [Brachionus calyciflorus]|uniref:Uncharacterized protein n=1 Tax=Brachionus calyciflorus TaxID=104777 RepID=A0A814KP66_9BILA|nr:unnamed protein product [Brachionus calyciflorus]
MGVKADDREVPVVEEPVIQDQIIPDPVFLQSELERQKSLDKKRKIQELRLRLDERIQRQVEQNIHKKRRFLNSENQPRSSQTTESDKEIESAILSDSLHGNGKRGKGQGRGVNRVNPILESPDKDRANSISSTINSKRDRGRPRET